MKTKKFKPFILVYKLFESSLYSKQKENKLMKKSK